VNRCNLDFSIHPSSRVVRRQLIDGGKRHIMSRCAAPVFQGRAMPPISGPSMDGVRVNRIRFRAWRRGFREADLILGPFADRHAPSMTPAELDRFEALLEQNDHDVYAWILGSLPAPAAFDDDLMARLRAFRPGEAAAPPNDQP
jgi:antitoxin CptB